MYVEFSGLLESNSALNDFWNGHAVAGLMTPTEVQAYVLPQSLLFETNLNQPEQTTAMIALEYLLKNIHDHRMLDRNR